MSEIQATWQTPPPGWYPNGNGQQQWWDGQQWGQLAPPPAPTFPQQQSNGFAVAGLVFGILAALTIPFGLIMSNFWVSSFFGFVPIVLGVIFGWIGVHKSKATGIGRQIATTGLVLSAMTGLMPFVMALP